MTIANIHSDSLRFAERQLEICRYTAQAAMINREDALRGASGSDEPTARREIHAANQLHGEAIRQLRAAKNKREFEIRELSKKS